MSQERAGLSTLLLGTSLWDTIQDLLNPDGVRADAGNGPHHYIDIQAREVIDFQEI